MKRMKQIISATAITFTLALGFLGSNDAVALCEIEKLKAEQKQKEADEYRTNPRGQGMSAMANRMMADNRVKWALEDYAECIQKIEQDEKLLKDKRARNETQKLDLEHQEMLLYERELELKQRELEAREKELDLHEKQQEPSDNEQ